MRCVLAIPTKASSGRFLIQTFHAIERSRMRSRKQIFQVQNVKCGGCASTLKSKLFDQFGEVEVNLEKEPREIILKITDEELPALKKALKKLGYPMVNEEMGFVETNATKAKSIISCAMGKINQ